ncbi:MAG: DUF58 domain-containing protein [Bryobacterales bacterium]|nr:DUF58 domain-containing protein [Bryobacterales bacterium]
MTGLGKIWRELRLAFSQGRQHVTRAGMAFTAALLLVALAAFLSANNLLFLILAAMFSTFLIAGFVSKLGLAGLELDLLLPEHISARRKLRAGIRVKNVKKWIASFSIHLAGAAESGFDSILYFPVIPGGATLEESVTIYFPRRGAQRERSFQFSTRFPFGFAERREMVTLRHEIVIYPCLDPQPGFEELLESVTGEIEARQRGRGHDFYRIRPYEAFENAHHVDWKATAHTGSLQVREFARDQDWRVVVYLDLIAPPGAEWFERAVECCAFLTHRLAGKGVHVRFRTQEFDVTVPREGDIHAVLKYLALVTPKQDKMPAAPDDPASFEIVFSENPERMISLGWGLGDDTGTRVVGPSDLEPSKR